MLINVEDDECSYDSSAMVRRNFLRPDETLATSVSVFKNDRVLHSISADYLLDTEKIGFGRLMYWVSVDALMWVDFFPYRYVDIPTRSGLGTVAHFQTLLAVREALSDAAALSVGHFQDVSYGRRQHLTAMGIDYRAKIPFSQYFELSQKYATKKGFSIDCIAQGVKVQKRGL